MSAGWIGLEFRLHVEIEGACACTRISITVGLQGKGRREGCQGVTGAEWRAWLISANGVKNEASALTQGIQPHK